MPESMDMASWFSAFLNAGTEFNDELEGLGNSIRQLPFGEINVVNINSFNVGQIIDNVVGAIEPIAFSLAAFFFMIGFLKKTMMFEFVTMENVVKCLLRLVVGKILIDNSLFLVEQFAFVCNDLIAAVTNEVQNALNYTAGQGQAVDLARFVLQFTQLGLIDKIFQMIIYFPQWIVIQVCKIIIFVQLWGRFLLITLYAMVSPIPFAGIITEETSGFTKTFVQNYAAILLQGLVMLLILELYIELNGLFLLWVPFTGIHVQLAITIILVFMLAKSGDMAKKIMGL